MDWDLKMPPSWDLAELEQDAAASASGVTVAAAAAAGGGGAAAGRPECSVDLKLGGLGEAAPAAADCGGGGKEPAAGASPPPVAGKRPRATGGGGSGGGGGAGQCPACAVDGCKADLSKCRDYHRRHKVCEAHSKTPVVSVAGREMRFCQQCSRFHLLAEFDENKRSCRKRLDGHNRRRRKPQPDTLNPASFITSQQGARYSSFAVPRAEPSWPGIIKTEENPYYTHQIPLGIATSSSSRQHFAGGSASAYGAAGTKEAGRRFPFLQEGEMSFAAGLAPLEAPSPSSAACRPLLKTAAPPESCGGGGGGGGKMFSGGGLAPVLDSDCALSLLSAPANSSGIEVGRMVVQPTEHVPMAQPLVSGMQFGGSPLFARPQACTGAVVSTAGFSCPAAESEQQLNTVLGSNDGEMNYTGIFHVAGEGSSDGASPSLPFSWQ